MGAAECLPAADACGSSKYEVYTTAPELVFPGGGIQGVWYANNCFALFEIFPVNLGPVGMWVEPRSKCKWTGASCEIWRCIGLFAFPSEGQATSDLWTILSIFKSSSRKTSTHRRLLIGQYNAHWYSKTIFQGRCFQFLFLWSLWRTRSRHRSGPIVAKYWLFLMLQQSKQFKSVKKLRGFCPP